MIPNRQIPLGVLRPQVAVGASGPTRPVRPWMPVSRPLTDLAQTKASRTSAPAPNVQAKKPALPLALPGSTLIPGGAMPFPMMGMSLRNTTVYVGKISEHISDEFMKQLLSICGEIIKWNRATDPTTKKLVAFGFCEFDSSEGVYRALKFLDGKLLAGKEILVNCDEKNKYSLDVWVRQQRKIHLDNLKMAEAGKDVKKTSEELDEMILESNKEHLDKIDQMCTEKNDEFEKGAADREKEEKDREREEQKKKEKALEDARREKERKERRDVDSDGERKKREARDEDDERRRKLRRLRSNPRQRERENKRRERERQEAAEQSRLIREFERKEDRRIRDYKEGMDQLKAPGEREKKRLIEKEIRESKRVKPLSASEDKDRKRRMEKERERDEEDALAEARELDEEESKRREEEDRAEEEWRDEEARKARQKKHDEDHRDKEKLDERFDRERRDEEEQERRVREAVAGLSQQAGSGLLPPAGMPPINMPSIPPMPSLIDCTAALTEMQYTEEPRQQASVASFSMAKKQPETQSLSAFEAADEANRKHAPLQKLENPNDKVNKQKEQDVKTLIAQIPTAKREVFSFPIDWECVRANNIIDTKLKPWVRKKVIEYLGAEEITMIEFILNKVEAASRGGEGPDHILTELESFIDEEAEGFVLKMWRMIIFENLRVKKT